MKRYVVSVILSALLFSSCITTKYISIDVYQPARVTLPPEIVNVAVVDNTPYSSQELKATNGKDIQRISLDTAKVVFVDSLSAYLDRENFFGEVLAYPDLTGADNDQPQALAFSKIRQIAQEMGVDAIVSLDNFFVSGKLYKVEDPYAATTQEMSLGMFVKLSTYSAEGQPLSDPIILNDTLYWSELLNYYPYFQPLPSFNQATQDMAIMAAESLVRQFVPYWETQNRAYFSNGKTDQLIESYKWNEALTIWNTELEKEKKETKKACLAHNIALAYECLGNLDEAVTWINKAVELLSNTNVEDVKTRITLYSITLKQRTTALQKLEEQIGSSEVSSEADNGQ